MDKRNNPKLSNLIPPDSLLRFTTKMGKSHRNLQETLAKLCEAMKSLEDSQPEEETADDAKQHQYPCK